MKRMAESGFGFRKILLTTALAVLFFAAFTASVVNAATIYVPDDYETIQDAVDNATAGDTIIVRDGTYNENVDVKKDRLTVRSENGPASTALLTYFEGRTHGKTVSSRFSAVSHSPPESLLAEPDYSSTNPLYGAYLLGDGEDTTIVFSMDESDGTGSGYDMVYVDSNNNEDLTDDGGPHFQEQEPWVTGLAFHVDVRVSYADGTDRPYRMWTFFQDWLLRMGYYTHCYYEGSIMLEDQNYPLFVYDFDADALYNDPPVPSSRPGHLLYIDLDRSGTYEGDGLGATIEGGYEVGDQFNIGSTTFLINEISNVGDTVVISITGPTLRKNVKAVHEAIFEPATAEMTISYNWFGQDENGEDVYVISKIDCQSLWFVGYYWVSIESQTDTIWSDVVMAPPFGKTYSPPFTPSHFGKPCPEEMQTSEGMIKVHGYDWISVKAYGVTESEMLTIAKIVMAIMGLPTMPASPPFFSESAATYIAPDYIDTSDFPPIVIEEIEILPGTLGHLCSPGELRIYDSQGRVTGLLNGEIKQEIPDSAYFNGSFLILVPSDSYRYEVVGTEAGTYDLGVISIGIEKVNAFGAADISTSTNATHQYTIDWEALSQGEEGVTIQIDNDGDGVFEQTIITGVTFQLPIASFTYSPAHPVINETITFNASDSYDPDGTITNYKWNFGDGNTTEATESLITHSYVLAGEYTVNLIVTDDDGATNSTSQLVTVTLQVGNPDLIITEKWLCWPENCTIYYNVTNTGDGTAPACHNTTLYVDGVEVAHDHVPVDLALGESYIGCFDGYTWTYTPPSDNITVCADNNETLDELDEDNNCLTNIWMCGDVRKDGYVTAWDVAVLNSYVAGIGELEVERKWAGDVRTDGYITAWDVAVLNSKVAGIGAISCMCTQPGL